MTFMQRPPLITFCIPFYKGLTYLKEALQSVSRQTVPFWRCIVVDDFGPEEGVHEWIKSLGDPRFSYQRNAKNLGLAGNWNRCLSLAESKLVTLLHADDRLDPKYAETMLHLADRYPKASAYFCRARTIGVDGKKTFSLADQFKKILMPSLKSEIVLRGESSLASIVRGNFIFCPTLCFRKAELGEEEFDGKWKMVLDLNWIAQSLLNEKILVGSSEVAYEYRRHSENQSVMLTRSQLRFVEEIEIHRNIEKYCLDKGWNRAAKTAKSMLSVRLHICYQIFDSLLHMNVQQVNSFSRVLLYAISDRTHTH